MKNLTKKMIDRYGDIYNRMNENNEEFSEKSKKFDMVIDWNSGFQKAVKEYMKYTKETVTSERQKAAFYEMYWNDLDSYYDIVNEIDLYISDSDYYELCKEYGREIYDYMKINEDYRNYIYEQLDIIRLLLHTGEDVDFINEDILLDIEEELREDLDSYNWYELDNKSFERFIENDLDKIDFTDEDVLEKVLSYYEYEDYKNMTDEEKKEFIEDLDKEYLVRRNSELVYGEDEFNDAVGLYRWEIIDEMVEEVKDNPDEYREYIVKYMEKHNLDYTDILIHDDLDYYNLYERIMEEVIEDFNIWYDKVKYDDDLVEMLEQCILDKYYDIKNESKIYNIKRCRLNGRYDEYAIIINYDDKELVTVVDSIINNGGAKEITYKTLIENGIIKSTGNSWWISKDYITGNIEMVEKEEDVIVKEYKR